MCPPISLTATFRCGDTFRCGERDRAEIERCGERDKMGDHAGARALVLLPRTLSARGNRPSSLVMAARPATSGPAGRGGFAAEPVCRCVGPASRCAGVSGRRAGVPACRAGQPVCRCVGLASQCAGVSGRLAGEPVCRAGEPVLRCVGPVCRCASVPASRRAGATVCRAGETVCRCVGPARRCGGGGFTGPACLDAGFTAAGSPSALRRRVHQRPGGGGGGPRRRDRTGLGSRALLTRPAVRLPGPVEAGRLCREGGA
jgi:hypothetical protein